MPDNSNSIWNNRLLLAGVSGIIGGSLALLASNLIQKYFKDSNEDIWLIKNQNEDKKENFNNFEDSLNIDDYKSEEYQKICKEQLVRNYQFFGEEKQKKLSSSFVIIIGVGGVGR